MLAARMASMGASAASKSRAFSTSQHVAEHGSSMSPEPLCDGLWIQNGEKYDECRGGASVAVGSDPKRSRFLSSSQGARSNVESSIGWRDH
jgi:hypothetical protein